MAITFHSLGILAANSTRLSPGRWVSQSSLNRTLALQTGLWVSRCPAGRSEFASSEFASSPVPLSAKSPSLFLCEMPVALHFLAVFLQGSSGFRAVVLHFSFASVNEWFDTCRFSHAGFLCGPLAGCGRPWVARLRLDAVQVTGGWHRVAFPSAIAFWGLQRLVVLVCAGRGRVRFLGVQTAGCSGLKPPLG